MNLKLADQRDWLALSSKQFGGLKNDAPAASSQAASILQSNSKSRSELCKNLQPACMLHVQLELSDARSAVALPINTVNKINAIK